MQLRASPQLKVGTAAWSRAGERHLTVIAKLTYELRSGTSELRATAEDLLLGEVPDDDLEGWMRVADLVPFKQRPEVLVIGGRPNGGVGLRFGAVDKRCATAAELSPRNGRRRGIGPATGMLEGGILVMTLPSTCDGEHFNAAPADQRLPIWPEVPRLVLDGLHPQHAHLETELEGFALCASLRSHGAMARSVPLDPDTLVIDADRGLATLSARASIRVARFDLEEELVVTCERASQVRERAPSNTSLFTSPVDALWLDTGTAASPANTSAANTSDATPAWLSEPRFRMPIERAANGEMRRVDQTCGPPEMLGWIDDGAHEEEARRAALRAQLEEAATRGLAAASAAAAASQAPSPKPVVERASSRPPSSHPPPSRAFDLLWYEPSAVSTVEAQLQPAPVDDIEDEWLEDDDSPGDARCVFRDIVASAPRTPLAELPTLLREAASRDPGARPIVCVEGEWIVQFDPRQTLDALIDVAMLHAEDKGYRQLLEQVRERTSAKNLPEELLGNLQTQIRSGFARSVRGLSTEYLDASVERMLVDKRSSAVRSLFGGVHLRAQLEAQGQRLVSYVAEGAALELPLAPRFPATVVAEVRPRQEYHDPAPLALRVLGVAMRMP